MNQRTMLVANVGLIVAAVIIGIFLYPALPAQMASHWDISGAANGSMPKLWAIFLFPVLMILTLGLSIVLPMIDPMKKNIELFRRSYQNFFLWIGVFMFYLFVITLGWNLGWRFNMTVALVPALAVLWFVVGVLLGRAKQNWFVGIRTPWTMESESVWDKTHALGSLLFRISAGITLLGIFFPQLLFYFLILPIITSSVVCIVYSYIEFRRERV